ncbi:MAG TPA: cupin domain-containing protein [Alphaproteobacteria bacterium]|nr:cupin domain-containing protein [Alphaproteobacteria bacterium]
MAIATLADLLHPVTPEAFFAEYYDRKPLHVPGGAAKFAEVMSWRILSDLLNMNAIWSAASLNLVIDRQPVPAEQFCAPAVDRDGRSALRPVAERVGALLRQGATLVANDIDSLTPALKSVARLLEEGIGGKAQANLYCSRRERQAFHSHFDFHDVFAVHVEGEKTWNVYERRVEHPINHPQFHWTRERHEAERGPVMMQVPMKPGDLLYLPRGWYHDALATTDGCIHIAFGLTTPIGLDAVTALFDELVADHAFRRPPPRALQEGDAAAAGPWLDGLAERVAAALRSPAAAARIAHMVAGYRYPRGGFDLPADAVVPVYRLAGAFQVVREGGAWKLKGSRGAVPVPPGLEGPIGWIVERGRFSDADFAAAHPALGEAARRRLYADLAGMKVLQGD